MIMDLNTMFSPEYPQSNGFAEKCVQTIKKMFLKCKNVKTDLYLGLLNLGKTLISTSKKFQKHTYG